MPYVRIELVAGRSEDQKAAIAAAVTQAMVEHGGANPQSVWVVFDDVQKQNWATGGTLMSRKEG